ncbi:MAG: class I SAM-dependent methyltransferase [Geobacteraceae bacterium]|nr:class I SAM-dependent methyltransferase [Geobacteraceae bacterium]
MQDKAAERTVTHISGSNYDLPYFKARNQDQDRPALWFYERIARRWIKPGVVLDYGCGTGFMLRRLARYYDVAGFDVSSHALDAVRKNVSAANVYGEEESIPKGLFSGIVSIHVLEHINKDILFETLACWHSSLINHGRVLCAVPDYNGRGRLLSCEHWIGFGDPSHVTLLGAEEWRTIFTSAGFSVFRVGSDGLWNLPYRKGKWKVQDGIRFSIPALVQFILGRLILPMGSGESAIFLLEKA